MAVRSRSNFRNQARRSSAEERPTIVIWSTESASARVAPSKTAALNCGSCAMRARQAPRESTAIEPALTASMVRS